MANIVDTVVDFLGPLLAQKYPQAQYFYGSLAQINQGLEGLQVGRPCVCSNNVLPFKVEYLGTGAQVFSHTVTLMLAVKSHPAWGPAQRNQAQRYTLAVLRLLPGWLQAAGCKIEGTATGTYFINMFDTNLDGVSVSYQLQLPDTYDYCATQLPPLPNPGV